MNSPRSLNSLSSFIYGLGAPIYGLKLILRTPRVLAWSLMPAAITVFLYAIVLNSITTWASESLIHFANWLGFNGTNGVIHVMIWLTEGLILIPCLLAFSGICVLIASPFNDFLAESVEKCVTPPLPAAPPASIRHTLRCLWIDFGKSIAVIVASIADIFLSFIPILNILALILTCYLITLQYVSYPQTRRGQQLADGLRFLSRHSVASLGFGISVTLLFRIPLLAPLVLPMAVVGGTLLVARAPGNAQMNLPALR